MLRSAIFERGVRVATFAERFYLLKTEKDVSLEVIAKCVGTTKSSLSQFVRGKFAIRQEMVQALADYFDVDQAYLLGESDIRRKDIDDIINNAYITLAKSAKEKGISPEKLKRIIDAL